MPNIVSKNLKYDNDENWVLYFTFLTFGTKGYGRIPINLVSRFTTMEIYSDDGSVMLSSYTDCSNSAMSNAVSGIVVLDFPMSATSAIEQGLYEYAVYILDFPFRTSATYAKKAMEGTLEVT